MRRQLATAILTLGLCGAFFLSCASAPKAVPVPCVTVETAKVSLNPTPTPRPRSTLKTTSPYRALPHIPASEQTKNIVLTEADLIPFTNAILKRQVVEVQNAVDALNDAKWRLGVDTPAYAAAYRIFYLSLESYQSDQSSFNEHFDPILKRGNISEPTKEAVAELERIIAEEIRREEERRRHQELVRASRDAEAAADRATVASAFAATESSRAADESARAADASMEAARQSERTANALAYQNRRLFHSD